MDKMEMSQMMSLSPIFNYTFTSILSIAFAPTVLSHYLQSLQSHAYVWVVYLYLSVDVSLALN